MKTNDAADEPVAPGTEVEYTYDVTNTGNTDLEIVGPCGPDLWHRYGCL